MDPSYFFCPRPGCPAHRLDPPASRWFYRHGFHDTIAFGRVRRYRCRYCGKTFSDQTFLLNYWLKKPTDFSELGRAINSSSSSGFVGRHHHLSADSLRIRHDRLCRNGLYLQVSATAEHRISETLAADGLESFVRDQYYPLNLNILIGAHSEFVYFFTESHSRRKGRMSEAQRKRASTEYRDKSFRESRLTTMFDRLLSYLPGRTEGEEIVLCTDEHPTYKSVIAQWNKSEGRPKISHEQTPGTAPRTKQNPLFAVNYFDRLIRKDLPNHRRETICQARNDRNLLSRFTYYVVTHNFFKPHRITSKAEQAEWTHAEQAGIEVKSIERWKGWMHEKRFFRSFAELPDYFEDIWFRRTPTPLARGADPVPKFAYQ